MAIRLNEYLAANDLLPRYQSAYRKQHSTETAMLRVWSHILTAAGTRQVTLLGLLDMSAGPRSLAATGVQFRPGLGRAGVDPLVPDWSWSADRLWMSIVDD